MALVATAIAQLVDESRVRNQFKVAPERLTALVPEDVMVWATTERMEAAFLQYWVDTVGIENMDDIKMWAEVHK